MLRKYSSKTTESNIILYGRIIAKDPIVTISKRWRDAPLGIAGAAPDFFRKKHALHILSDTWHSYNQNKRCLIKKDLQRLSRYLVNNHIIYLGNTQYETWLLSRSNISAIHSSELISIDESIFKPGAEQLCKIAPAEAVYNARLDPFKRHNLAYGLIRLALIYRDNKYFKKRYEELKCVMPHWYFINNEIGNGQYYYLNNKEVASILNQCQVGLCLSSEEGAMRASMEYLLCGLPVVTIRNIGGRDRYFDKDNSIYADDTPESVAEAVQVFLNNMPDRMDIRNSVLQKIQLDRNDFVNTINEIIKSIYGVSNLFNSYSKIIGYIENRRPVSEILADCLD